MQLYYLEYLQDKDNSKALTKINQISNIGNNKSLLFIRCKIYIKSKKYEKAKSDLDILFKLNDGDISFICLLRKYSGFWSYLYKGRYINNELGIVDKFNQFMYDGK